MNRHVNTIANRLSLRTPQRESLEILARLGDILSLQKDANVDESLRIIQGEFATVEAFERDFPSFCFALATGVGKTRLMGAFIAYLYRARAFRHFFVLAPNLTIYNKLITDFTPNTPKYVFQGIGEFAQNPPELITGDNYESGRGVRDEASVQPALPGFNNKVHINIFNISKINTEVRGGKAPRIKRLSEYIGESYFDYLSKLDDLVLLMDESHRYRAAAGVQAINELKPILGLELTATPQIEKGKNSTPFKNVIYSYPLSSAMEDGYVKEPAVATRENFDASQYDAPALERLKLEDGIRIHENTKVELEIYARETGQFIVKPFMLVVAQDTTHAEELARLIEAPSFFEGRYQGKVTTVHSKKSGQERDETVEQLLSVEDRNNPVEIVIHVNMLKEGWDVTNLYTIVPLRAANSKTLVEQSIGRGLRLPYGKRTGVPAVDRLTIVSHDRFQEIVDHANDPNSIIRSGVVIGRDIPLDGKKMVTASPTFLDTIIGQSQPATQSSSQPSSQPEPNGQPADGSTQPPLIYPTAEERRKARAVNTIMDVLPKYETLSSSTELTKPEIRQQIKQEVAERLALPPSPATPSAANPAQQIGIEGVHTEIPSDEELTALVDQTVEQFSEKTIDIPRIVVLPTDASNSGYRDFDLDVSGINLQPVETNILIQHLQSNKRDQLATSTVATVEAQLENYIVRGLIDFNDINYDKQADLLYKLSGQLVAHLHSYLPDEAAVLNVLQYHEKQLAELVHTQMQDHYYEDPTSFAVEVSKGFHTLSAQNFAIPTNEGIRNFRETITDRGNIRNMLFGGFARCVFPYQKFDSDSERRFAILLENEADPKLKWLKPSRKEFQIYYDRDKAYEPDFVIETATVKYISEPKRADQMNDPEVQAKARAAAIWCQRATDHTRETGGKPWKYLLIPHDAIRDNMTLAGLASQYEVKV